ncbi:MAG: ABC transporter ATP-binding protein [Anaerolineae bacterium]
MHAVRRVDLEVHAGEVVVLLGPNGAGKTTTVRMLSAILAPTEGQARVAGFDVVRDAVQVRRAVGLLTEYPGLYPRMRAPEYLMFFAELYGVPAARRRERVQTLLEQFGLWDVRHQPLVQYSKGMAQKLAFVRAILHDPQVLFLDEPTAALDPLNAKRVRDTIQELKRQGKAVLVCTHNLLEARELADRIVVLGGGEVLAEGRPEEMFQRYVRQAVCEIRFVGPWNEAWRDTAAPLVTIEEIGEGLLRYRTEDAVSANPVLVGRLSAVGMPIISVQILSDNLEEVYLAIVAEKEMLVEEGGDGL